MSIRRPISKILVIVLACSILGATIGIFPGVAGSGESVTESWVAHYDGPTHGPDYAIAIAVDSSGNVYVTGSSLGNGTSLDYATIKYDSNGNHLWVARYDGPANNEDSASAIAIDGSGNVYITGASTGNGTSLDYATIKYDSNGNQSWVARYDGPIHENDRATAIAVDSWGNVYVSGQSSSNYSYPSDFATIKYSPDGTQLWVERYDDMGGGDGATAIAVGGSGNVYVTGFTLGWEYHCDYATIKYDTNGNQTWITSYDGPSNWVDYSLDIALDSSGNVYVTGESTGIGIDYATIKYDNNGNQSWVARYNGPTNDDDEASAIAVDSSGNIYVTGKSTGNNTSYYHDYATIKYDNNGNQAWVARYDGPANCDDRASAIAIDGSGNVYVTGIQYNGGVGNDFVFTTIKYDKYGNQVWIARHDGQPSNGYRGPDIALGGSSNIYVSGESLGEDYVTIKYVQGSLVETSISEMQDGDGVVVLPIGIVRVKDGDSGDTVPGVQIGCYHARALYSPAGIEILTVRPGDAPFSDPVFSIDNPQGNMTFWQCSDGAGVPIAAARLVPRLLGSVLDSYELEVAFDLIADQYGNEMPEEQPHFLAFQRGDVNGDGIVNIVDAMFGAQYLVGLRPIEDIHQLNMASVHYDGENGNVKDIIDCMYIAQYVVGIRDCYFEMVP